LVPEKNKPTTHRISLTTSSSLGGQIELRATDAAGNRTEQFYDAFTTMDPKFQFGVGGWAFEVDGTWVRAANVFRADDFRVNTLQARFGGYDWDETYDSVE
jgi:hypothetical protein